VLIFHGCERHRRRARRARSGRGTSLTNGGANTSASSRVSSRVPALSRRDRESGHENDSRGLLFWLGPLGSGDRDRGSRGERMVGRPILGRWASEPGLFGGRPCDLSGCAQSAECATTRRMTEWNEISNDGPSQRVAEAGGSLTLEAQGVGGSSPDNDGTGRYCQTARVRQVRWEGVARANQWLNPLKRGIGSNLVDVGRDAVHAGPDGLATPWPVFRGWRGGHEEDLRRTHGEAAWEKLGAASVNRSAMNVGTILGLPAVGGQARCRLLAPGWGGAFAVVRAGESPVHGEGRQRTCSIRLEGEEVGVE
jgi:hypothetical protein